MKKFLFLIAALFSLASCEKFDEETSEAFRKAAQPPKKNEKRQPASSYIRLEVYADNNGAVGSYIDEVRQDWNTTYDLAYNPVEDTANVLKLANDLGINFANEVLKVNAIPYCNADIPISFRSATYGQYYWLKVTSYNTSILHPVIYDEYFKNLDGSLSLSIVHMNPDGTALQRFEMNGDRSIKFRIVTTL